MQGSVKVSRVTRKLAVGVALVLAMTALGVVSPSRASRGNTCVRASESERGHEWHDEQSRIQQREHGREPDRRLRDLEQLGRGRARRQ